MYAIFAIFLSVFLSFFVIAAGVMLVTGISGPAFVRSTPQRRFTQPSLLWVAWNLLYSSAFALLGGWLACFFGAYFGDAEWSTAASTCNWSLIGFMLVMSVISAVGDNRSSRPPPRAYQIALPVLSGLASYAGRLLYEA